MASKVQIKAKVTWDKASVNQKVTDTWDDSTTLLRIQGLYAGIIDEYTPYWTGNLSENIKIDETGVTYLAPYARKQYYHSLAYHKEEHPLATKQWDEVAMQAKQGEFEAKVKEILKERARKLYG